MKGLKDLFVGGDRNRPFLTFVEGEAWWISGIIFAFFFVVLGCSLIFLGAFQPLPYNETPYALKGNASEFFNGTLPCFAETQDNKLIYQELIFYAKFENTLPAAGTNESTQYFGFSKDDLMFDVRVTGWDLDDEIFKGQIKGSLRCVQYQECDKVYLFRIAPVFKQRYNFTMTLTNGYNLFETKLLTSKVQVVVRNVAQDYTTISVILRIIFLITSTGFTIIYLIALILRQYFKLWASEQRFTVVLLFLTILYNNPLFFFEFLNGSWVFPFVSNIFIVNYICFLLLSLLVFTHSVITTKSQRYICSFYVSKFAIVGILWVFLIVAFTLYSVNTTAGSANIDTKSVAFIGFSASLMILFIIYFLSLVYYFVRVVSKIRILPGKNRKKFVYTWLFTFVIMILTTADAIIYIQGSQKFGGASYNAFFIAYNLYTFSMAILFWPARNESSEKEEEREKQILQMSEESEFKF